MPSLLAITHSTHDPASRFRVMQFLPRFREAGWTVVHHPFRPSLYRKNFFHRGLGDPLERVLVNMFRRSHSFRRFNEAEKFDAVLVSRELPCLQTLLLRRTSRLILDIDDDIFHGTEAAAFERLCRSAKLVVAGNETLARSAEERGGRVRIIPTTIDVNTYRESVSDRPSNPVRLGWLGSPYSLGETLGPVMNMLADLQAALGFEFVIVSSHPETVPVSRLSWRFVPWSPATETTVADLFDIGIMPLQDMPAQRAKCGCKLLQYMAAGLPAIASPLGVNLRILQHGETGFHATSKVEWGRAIETLAKDPELRRGMGRRGREKVTGEYSIEAWLPRWLDILEEVAAGP